MIRHINEKAGFSNKKLNFASGSLFFSESVSLLQKLIRTPSFSGEEAEAADIVQQFLESYNIKTNRFGNNIWCYNKYYNASKPTILLNSHLDTVKPNEGYTIDPFYPEIEGGRLYGLGSNDAGGCLVSLTAAFLHFYSYQGLGFNLCLAVTAEEENSGQGGIKSILPSLGALEFGIVGEPTLLQMAIEERGNLVIDCTSAGRSGHAAREEGENAIYKCMADLEWFRKYKFPYRINGMASVKMTVTMIKAGMQHNIIPAKCEFTVDIRHDNTYTPEQILNIIKQNVTAQISVRPSSSKASSVPVNHPIVKAGLSIGCKTYVSPTSSDQAWLTIPSVKLGPGDSARSHSSDEFVYLEEIKKGTLLYIKLLETLPLMLINNPDKEKIAVNH